MVTKNKPMSNADALRTTLETMELPFEAAAIVALCQSTAAKLDSMSSASTYLDAYPTVANSYLRQLAELRQWVVAPEVVPVEERDPFDELAKALQRGESA
jgi:hypothetical protein